MTLVDKNFNFKQFLTLNKEAIESLDFKELEYDHNDPKYRFLKHFSIDPNVKEFTMFKWLRGYDTLRLFFSQDAELNIIIVDLLDEQYFGMRL